jgi:hypothetical protein
MNPKNVGSTPVFPAEYFATQFRTEGAVDRWPKRFAIVTAYAITGEVWTVTANEAADQNLKHAILVSDIDRTQSIM